MDGRSRCIEQASSIVESTADDRSCVSGILGFERRRSIISRRKKYDERTHPSNNRTRDIRTYICFQCGSLDSPSFSL